MGDSMKERTYEMEVCIEGRVQAIPGSKSKHFGKTFEIYGGET